MTQPERTTLARKPPTVYKTRPITMLAVAGGGLRLLGSRVGSMLPRNPFPG